MVFTSSTPALARLILQAIICVLFSFAIPVQAQTTDCRDELPGYLVRSVTVKARWFPDTLLPLKRGDEFTPDKVSALRLAVINAIGKEKKKHATEFVALGRIPGVATSFARACGRPAPVEVCQAEQLTDKCTDVEVEIFALSVDAINIGSTMLPIPHTNKFSFLSEVPRPLRVLNPKFGLGQDRELGVTPKIELSTDLLALPKLLEHEPPSNKASLLLSARGSKSVNEPYYTSQISLAFRRSQPTEHIESVGFDTSFAADELPQRENRFLRNAFRAGGHLAFNPAAGLVNRVVLDAAYRRSSNRLEGGGVTPPIFTTENSYEARTLVEGKLWDGFMRWALWLDGGKPERTARSYHRAATLVGYEKEIPLGEHTIGTEVLFGAGRTSDATLEYARFFGGNTLGNFLYDDDSDPNLIAMPTGPLLRSFGRNQAGAMINNAAQGGGNSYQHFNLTVSLPLPRLSAPLIPNEQVTPQRTLRTLIKSFVLDSAQEAVSLSFQEDGLDQTIADEKAKKVVEEIRPGVNYLADYAKIYALKPLFMFDVARLARAGEVGSQTRYAVGGGLQLTIVVVKFEIGYMHTVRRFEGDRRGNLIARLIFHNLF